MKKFHKTTEKNISIFGFFWGLELVISTHNKVLGIYKNNCIEQ